MKNPTFSVFLVLFNLFLVRAAISSPCGDWEPYKDEKCVKLIDETHLYEDAIRACEASENTSTLLSIRSAEEQAFMSNLLFNVHKVVDEVWIGAHQAGTSFKWTDDSPVTGFTNWAPGSPSNKPERPCVEMGSEVLNDSKLIGKWIDVSCVKKNVVVCERLQTWSHLQMQKILLTSRKELRDQVTALTADLASTKAGHGAQLALLTANPVPIGFTYVQLPAEKAPTEIFPGVKMNWTDVSASYAGVFFRVMGPGAEAFGKVQLENGPHLNQVVYQDNPCTGATATAQTVLGNWSGLVLNTNGWTAGAVKGCHKFLMTGGEVRPKNMAVKVWRRTA